MFALGKIYYIYIPELAELGLLGALLLGGVLVLLFLGVGWLYDAKGMMWSAKMQVAAERNPYRYVPSPREFAFNYATIYAMLGTLRSILLELHLEVTSLDDSIKHLDTYFRLRENKKDMVAAEEEGKDFMKTHPLSQVSMDDRGNIGWRAKVKMAFEVRLLRLSWIQQLTGMMQEALVFGAIYVVFLFPDAAVGNIVPINYLFLGLILLSLPLFTLVAVIGWLYDRRLKIWSVDAAVKVERNPFTYVAEPKLHGVTMPIYYALFGILKEIFIATGIETTEIHEILSFLDRYRGLSVTKESDMECARSLRKSFGDTFGSSERVS
jgi:hypothetical protein